MEASNTPFKAVSSPFPSSIFWGANSSLGCRTDDAHLITSDKGIAHGCTSTKSQLGIPGNRAHLIFLHLADKLGHCSTESGQLGGKAQIIRGRWVGLYWKPVSSRAQFRLTSFSVTFEEMECVLIKFAVMPEWDSGHAGAAIQRDLDWLEEWPDRKSMKFSKDKCKEIEQIQHVGRKSPLQQYRLEMGHLGSSFAGRDMGSSWTASWPLASSVSWQQRRPRASCLVLPGT